MIAEKSIERFINGTASIVPAIVKIADGNLYSRKQRFIKNQSQKFTNATPISVLTI